MRPLFAACTAALIVVILCVPASAQSASGSANLAQGIFSKADVNNNEFLNRAEFNKATGMLQAAIVALAKQGVIGRKGDKQSPGLANPDPDGDEKVTLPEWSAFVATALETADADLAKARERYAKRRKAAAKNRKKRNRRRRRRRRRRKK